MDNLNKEQIKFYQDNGYLRINNFFGQAEVEDIVQKIQEALSSEENEAIYFSNANREKFRKLLNYKVNVWKDYAPLKEIAFNKKLASIAAQLLGSSSVRLFQDQILIKEPKSARPTPWHRDITVWPMNEKSALTVWIALDNVDVHNGCMQFAPTSHKNENILVRDIWEPKQIVNGVKPDIMKMQAGSIHFHHCLTLHSAFGNNSSCPRRAYAIVYIADGTTYNGLSYHLTDKSGFTIGQVIAGESFPQLI